MTLAEILVEGRSTIDKWAPNVSDPIRDVTGVPIRVGTLRRLLTVAEAVVEIANGPHTNECSGFGIGYCPRCIATAAINVVASVEKSSQPLDK